MTISSADPKIFVSSGITITLMTLSVISASLPFILPKLKKYKEEGKDE
jgi:TctA family transporter